MSGRGAGTAREHDFGAFGQAPIPGRRTRGGQCSRRGWQEEPSGLTFVIEADAFLYRMVRRLVAALVAVGLGHKPPGTLAALVDRPEAAVARTSWPRRTGCAWRRLSTDRRRSMTPAMRIEARSWTCRRRTIPKAGEVDSPVDRGRCRRAEPGTAGEPRGAARCWARTSRPSRPACDRRLRRRRQRREGDGDRQAARRQGLLPRTRAIPGASRRSACASSSRSTRNA